MGSESSKITGQVNPYSLWIVGLTENVKFETVALISGKAAFVIHVPKRIVHAFVTTNAKLGEISKIIIVFFSMDTFTTKLLSLIELKPCSKFRNILFSTFRLASKRSYNAAHRTNRLISAQESVEAAKPELESYANMKTNGHK